MDALVQKIDEEDRAEATAEAQKKAETQIWIGNYLEERREWKRQEIARVKAEEQAACGAAAGLSVRLQAILDYAAKKRAVVFHPNDVLGISNKVKSLKDSGLWLLDDSYGNEKRCRELPRSFGPG